ncbi:MAG: hypothetical protein OXE50_15465 [Chloroflexi bacterium]|nr:hypothetical protein [Chloroflexota bacterium]
MDNDHRDLIARLVGEGKQISRVCREDFPQYSYIEVYWAAYGEGARSAMGIQRTISARLSYLESADKETRQALIKEISDLVCQQYLTITKNAKKLDDIRRALER